MIRDSLLGHIAFRTSAQTEYLATEAFTYILQKGSNARKAFLRTLRDYRPSIPEDLRFIGQDREESGGIPDVVGFDTKGTRFLIIEAKFWAGLTERQPVKYLCRGRATVDRFAERVSTKCGRICPRLSGPLATAFTAGNI